MKMTAVLRVNVGIMQGRLSPPSPKGPQVFPVDSWPQEFTVASRLGLTHIEWLVDIGSLSTNPIWSSATQIEDLSSRTGVGVTSVCLDAGMHVSPTTLSAWLTGQFIRDLTKGMEMIGSRVLCIPLLGKTSLQQSSASSVIIKALGAACELADRRQVQIAVETDLDTDSLLALLNKVPGNNLGIVLDVGNSYTHGFDALEQYNALKERIQLIHLKDRSEEDQSVPLGRGRSQVLDLYSLLCEEKSSIPVTLEAFRGHQYEADIQLQLRSLAQACLADG